MSPQRGFTLIELLVVLTLVGLLVGMALPFGMRAIDNAQRRRVYADLGAQLSAYPLTAHYNGIAFEVDQPALHKALPDLPDDCSIALGAPLRYDASGLASGGRVVLTCAGDAPRAYTIARVTGAVQIATP